GGPHTPAAGSAPGPGALHRTGERHRLVGPETEPLPAPEPDLDRVETGDVPQPARRRPPDPPAVPPGIPDRDRRHDLLERALLPRPPSPKARPEHRVGHLEREPGEDDPGPDRGAPGEREPGRQPMPANVVAEEPQPGRERHEGRPATLRMSVPRHRA